MNYSRIYKLFMNIDLSEGNKYVGEDKYKKFSLRNANTMLWIFITQLVNVSIFPIIIIIRNLGVYIPFYPPSESKLAYILNLGA